jgi:hypothetical protein
MTTCTDSHLPGWQKAGPNFPRATPLLRHCYHSDNHWQVTEHLRTADWCCQPVVSLSDQGLITGQMGVRAKQLARRFALHITPLTTAAILTRLECL